MIDTDQAVEIDNILNLVGEPTLTTDELNYLNAMGAEIVNEPCDYYKYALETLESRHKFDKCPLTSIEALIRLADVNGCDLQPDSNEDDLLFPLFAAGINSGGCGCGGR